MRNLPAYLCAALLVFSACGAERPTPPTGKKKAGDDTGGQQNPQQPCPTTQPSAFHRVTIKFQRPLPAKLGLKLDFDTEMRVSECANRDQTKPFATLSRPAGTADTIVVQVDHHGFYNPLPRDVSFDLIDLQNCGPTTANFFSLRNQALAWRIDYPNGASCSLRNYATAELVSTLDGAVVEAPAE